MTPAAAAQHSATEPYAGHFRRRHRPAPPCRSAAAAPSPAPRAASGRLATRPPGLGRHRLSSSTLSRFRPCRSAATGSAGAERGDEAEGESFPGMKLSSEDAAHKTEQNQCREVSGRNARYRLWTKRRPRCSPQSVGKAHVATRAQMKMG